jgi:RNA polymerase sigma factor (sigma-70 family)
MLPAVNQAKSRSEFPQTRWSVIVRLRNGVADAEGAKVLAELCEAYWYPLYTFARRAGHSPHDAEDLTQGFFACLLECDLFAKADPSRGRLRSFLLGSFKHFMSSEWRNANREKRGGGRGTLPIHELKAEEINAADDTFDSNPELMFDRVWFHVLLDRALNHLEDEYRRRGRAEMFKRLQEFLAWNRRDVPLAEVARELGMSPGAVRVTILRMRTRFRDLIEREIAETVGTAAEAAAELDHLRQVLGL